MHERTAMVQPSYCHQTAIILPSYCYYTVIGHAHKDGSDRGHHGSTEVKKVLTHHAHVGLRGQRALMCYNDLQMGDNSIITSADRSEAPRLSASRLLDSQPPGS